MGGCPACRGTLAHVLGNPNAGIGEQQSTMPVTSKEGPMDLRGDRPDPRGDRPDLRGDR